MECNIDIPEFEGPLDLLLHLIKKDNIDIQNLNIEKITKQYMDYINLMEKLNLNIASEYLVMAAELLEIKSTSLLPKQIVEEDNYEQDTKENLIKKLLNYEQYKNISTKFKEFEEYRNEIYTKEPSILLDIDEENSVDYGVTLNDLIDAFSKFMKQKELSRPLNTKITNKEYSVGKRCNEIKKLLKKKEKVDFKDLLDVCSKEYIVVTFLAILSMSRNLEIVIEQQNNFKNIILKRR